MIKNWDAIRWRRVAALTTRFDSQIHSVVIIAATPANAGRDFNMLTVSSEQFDILAAHRAEDRLLECVCDWFALYEICYQRPAALSFDQAWRIGEHLYDRVALLPQPPGEPVQYSLIHTVLRLVENGANPDQLRRGLETYCRSLPAHEAGLILLETLCEPASIEGK